MRILMAIPHTLPAPDGGHGCPVMSWAMVKWLKEAGHEAHLFAFAPTASDREPERARARGHISRLGAPLIETSAGSVFAGLSPARLRLITARRVMRPGARDYFAESISHRGQWIEAVERVRPEAFWLYTMDAVALADQTFSAIPRLASLVDLDHEAREVKRSLRPGTLRNRGKNALERIQDRALPKAMIGYLRSCEVVVEHSISSADWLRGQGIPAEYFPNPVDSKPLSPDWFPARERLLRETAPRRILMVGYLRGIATQTGLHLLADEVLPALLARSELGQWEVHVVGGGELPAELQAKLATHPRVRLRGFVDDLAAEYQRAHLNLVTVSERLGFRTRLVEAFAYGSPSVVHANNRYGMPELQDGENVLLAGSGEDLARAIARLLTDDALRSRLEQNARKTYEERLSVEFVMSAMFRMLEEAVGSRL
ncbi:MAG: glycosyltransferase family 4 protein [Blastocatellia bacterium]